VLISVIGDAGESRHQFRLRTRDADGAVQILDLPASGQLTWRPAAGGLLELTLLHPEGCRVAGANPRTLSVAAGEEVEVDFDVRCGP
jgi:hypothetical protein